MDDLKIYEEICFIREFENKLSELFKRGLVGGTAHFCIGQEFIPAIISQYLTDEDFVTSTHRGHGHAISKRLDIKKFLAELMGKSAGYNHGMGGSQHVSSIKQNFIANGVSGGMIPIANGLAFANKYKNSNNVVVAFLGDGGFNEGYVSESLNLASVMDLPVLFVCENNHYAMSTPTSVGHSSEIIGKVKAYNIQCELVDENDFRKLDSVAKEFISQIRKKPQPFFIEVKTYRHCGHSKNDQNLYRDKEEEKFWMEKDALACLEKELLVSKKITGEGIQKIKGKIREKLDSLSEEIISRNSEREDFEVSANIYKD
ncbi:thiamine pyrophosphate-dependent dehydrogenase E1 component subunit alpha [Candidatus Woesearchaeota archaeon]|nr:thiamine pyrophosphate-dependent dehydrogenase E1 component subunit alpha [Candidatus Woesearchaeota archaeon]